MNPSAAARTSYHHGDLRNALIVAATALAEKGGPDAVVLRAAAREVGVSPTAAYRHFAGQEELLHAVRNEASSRLADAMEAEVALAKGSRDPAVAARRRFDAAGRGYLAFAQTEPGAFRTFCAHTEGKGVPVDDRAFTMLTTCLDDMVTTGLMPASRRPYADLAVWSAVHGLALLILDGPIGALPPSDRDKVITRTFDMVRGGL